MDSAHSGSESGASVCPVTGANGDGGDTLPLVLYHGGDQPRVKAVPASRWRDWMSSTINRHANRCLPLLMANQSGWVLLNPAPFTATWDGEDRPSAMTIEYPADTPESQR